MIYKSKLIKVVDGDTVYMKVNLGLGHFCNALIRLKGVQAPEIFGVKKDSEEYKKGTVARLAVEKWFYGAPPVFALDVEERGYHGRLLGVICKYDEQRSLNEFLLEGGFAVKYENWYCQKFINEEW